MVVSHHFLIILIVSYSLGQQQTSWEELIFLIDGGLGLPTPKLKRMASIAAKPSKCRQSSYSKRIRGMIEGLLGSSSHPLEFPSSEDEQPLQLEGGSPRTVEDEEEMSHHTSGERQRSAREGNDEVEGEILYFDEEEEGSTHTSVEGDIHYSDEEEGSYHSYEEDEDNRKSENEREGAEPLETTSAISLQIPLQEDQLAQILASMSEYVQPHSPLNLSIDINQLQEQAAANKETTKGILDEIEGGNLNITT